MIAYLQPARIHFSANKIVYKMDFALNKRVEALIVWPRRASSQNCLSRYQSTI